jgi:uncharacterized protein YbaR (Trm112 family)
MPPGDDEPATERPAPRRVATIDVRMLELLACPLTKGLLRYDAEKEELISPSARLAYPIRDGIPILLPSEARAIEIE